jgi:hypothetical protein
MIGKLHILGIEHCATNTAIRSLYRGCLDESEGAQSLNQLTLARKISLVFNEQKLHRIKARETKPTLVLSRTGQGTRAFSLPFPTIMSFTRVFLFVDSLCEKPLRLYWEHRLAASISDTMFPYCIMDLNTGTFRNPTLEELARKTIVVTTLVTADMLIKCGVEPGFFTHIFIDEAAQAMEVETLIPLSLATEETKVVLAGDHLQVRTEYNLFSTIVYFLQLTLSFEMEEQSKHSYTNPAYSRICQVVLIPITNPVQNFVCTA